MLVIPSPSYPISKYWYTSAGWIVSHQVLAENLILRVGATVILVSILGRSEYRISSFRCAIVFCGISVPSENLSGRVMSRDAFTYGCLTQHSLPLELLQWIWQDWNPASFLCAGTHPIALSAAVVLMERLMKLLSFHVLVTLGWLVRCLYFFSQSAKMQFGLACFATWHWAKHRSFGCFQSNKDTFLWGYPPQHFLVFGAGLACAPKKVVSLVHLKSAMF